MSRTLVALLGLLIVTGCSGSSGPESQVAQLGRVSFEIPEPWRRSDTSRLGSMTSVWTPPSNSRKESVSVIRSERSQASRASSLPQIEQQLVSAQQSLRGGRISTVTPVTTEQGLRGSRIEVRFKPDVPGTNEQVYRRIHVVLVEEDALIHVLYTSAMADGDLAALDLVLATIRQEAQS